MLNDLLLPYRYHWSLPGSDGAAPWQPLPDGSAYVRDMPERLGDLAADSRWPSFFPSPISLVTTGDGSTMALEKVVGASIVNRFPYVVALSFCRQDLSPRHHSRRAFTTLLERSRCVAVQFLPPGPQLDSAMTAIAGVPEADTVDRLAASGLRVHSALTNSAPVFDDAYMVYEATLVTPTTDFEGVPIYPQPWRDAGSHRIYFLEINAIQLRQDIAAGRSQIHWRSLPVFSPHRRPQRTPTPASPSLANGRYQKPYTPHYAFPSSGTIAFEADTTCNGMAVKYLPPLPEDQVEVDNDKARWPCFFPSSVGMITTRSADGRSNVMPCGSTTVVSRHPMIVAPCVSYAAINERYAPRATLDNLRATGRFGCGVPFIDEGVLSAIKYAGNTSVTWDPEKIRRAGLEVEEAEWAPVLRELPVHFDCEVVGEERLGTHIMFLGEVRRIRVRADVIAENRIEWCPWADVAPVNGASH